MTCKREIKFVKALLGGKSAIKSSSGIYRLRTKDGFASLSGELVAQLISNGVLYSYQEQCFATEMALSWVKRQLSCSSEFLNQHSEIKLDSKGIACNLAEGPLGGLATSKKGRPAFLSPHHLLQAGKIQALVLRSQMMQRTTMSYDPTRIGTSKNSGVDGKDLADSAIDAKKKLYKKLSALPADCAGVVLDVCGFQKGLQLIETERRWPRRSAKLILRIGLEQLAVQSGAGLVATGIKPRRNHVWNGVNSRPTLFDGY